MKADDSAAFRSLNDRLYIMKSRLLIFILALLPLGGFAAGLEALRFGKDGKFKIVQFTDIHWQPGNPASEEATRCMDAVLDAERPDLVIYTGDLVYAAPAREAVMKAVEPAVKRGIPFAVTWGNHDDEFDATREELFAAMAGLPGNLSDSVAGLSGVNNFILPLLSARTDSAAAVLYVIDSNGYSTIESAKGYAGIQPDQIGWYRDNSRRFTAANGGRPIPSLAFFHVPLNEVNTAASDEYAIFNGTRRERACSASVNTGMFAEMLRCGDVMAAFFGHDHINDYAVVYKGVLLAYGRYSGGRTVYSDIPGGNGARVIEMSEGVRGFDSWIRLADGSVINTISFPHDFSRWKASNNE